MFAGLTIALTWLFWLPGAVLPGLLGDMLLGIGSFVPLGVAIFLDIWLRERSLKPLDWIRSLSLRGIAVALVIPLFLFIPLMLLRTYQGTFEVGNFISAARGMWLSFFILLVLAVTEEIGWRAYLLPRLKTFPLYLTNLFIGLLWFVWQLPVLLAGRYNESENFGAYLTAMFFFSLLITPFFNRLAMRNGYNPIYPAILRAGLQFVITVYFLQGRADPLTDTFGVATIAWLLVLNLILFSQLWQGKKPPPEITELERIMPLEAGN